MNSIELRGKYLRNLIRYIIPPAYANVGNSAALMIVSIWISRGVGNNALGAVNIVAPYLSFVFAYGLIFGAGGGTAASAYTAKGENKKANGVFTLSILLLTASMLIVAAVSYINRHALAVLLGATSENIQLVEEYFGYISIFSILFAIGYAMNVHLRFDGYQLRACIGSTLNIGTILLVSYVCIYVFKLGIAGVAWGLIASRIVIILYYLVHFISPHKGLRFAIPKDAPEEIKRIFLIGVPNALSEASTGIFILIFNYIAIFWLGNNGLVIFSVICYLCSLAVQSMLGVAQGMQPIISFHHAKEEHSLSHRYLRYTLVLTMVLSIGFTVGGYIFSDRIAGMYVSSSNTELFAQAVSALKMFSWFALAAGVNIIFIVYFSASQRAGRAMILSLGRSLIVICAAGLILPNIFGSAGIWMAPVINEFLVLVLVAYYCKKDHLFKELLPRKLSMLLANANSK